MHSFRVDGVEPEAFVRRVRETLAVHRFDEVASLAVDGSELVVTFRRLGTTLLRFVLRRDPDGFRADYAGARVAPLHAPFLSTFEERFEELLARVGARLVDG
jgi:hypothetical protein